MIKIIGSALIKNKENKYLALRLNKEFVGNSFVPPGGKLENNETLRECLIREVQEELNIHIEVGGIVAVTEEEYDDGYWTFVFFDAAIMQGSPMIMEKDKIIEMKWVDLKDIKDYHKIKWVR